MAVRNNDEAKIKLYTDGMTFTGKSVILYEQNPFSMNEEMDDPEKKHAKVRYKTSLSLDPTSKLGL